MSIEYLKNNQKNKIECGKQCECHTDKFILRAIGEKEGGKISIITDKGQVHEKKIELDLAPGSSIRIKSLDMMIRAE